MNILFIDIDTLRPDHMGCYGYSRNTTPNMDAVAADGLRFENYYCSDAPCLPSRAALISGKFGIRNGVVGHGGTAADMCLRGADRGFDNPNDTQNLINVFRRAGMYTASVSTFPERHSAWWFNAGFNETYNVGDRGLETGEKVLPVALDWIERNKGRKDWFFHVHLWDPHTPYRAPESFGNPFIEARTKSWITENILKKHSQLTGPHTASEVNGISDATNSLYPRQLGKIADMDDLKSLLDEYDTGIKYSDYIVGQIFDKLREDGLYEDTAIIITSDHGENMGEQGIYSEHATADLPTCHIPMIIKWPNARENAVDKGFRYNLDIVPTVADLLGVQKLEEWDGISYARALTEECDGREYLIISQMAHVCQRSARFGDWLYIRTYHDGYYLFDKEILYNVSNDPYEQNDVKDKYPDICAKGARYILNWHDEMMMKSGGTVDPLWTVLKEGGPLHSKIDLKAYCERLEQTGRKTGAEKLKNRANQKFRF